MMIKPNDKDLKKLHEIEKWMYFDGEEFVFKADTPKNLIQEYNKIQKKYYISKELI